MTCCLLAVARDEEKFIDEWVQHNLNLGFDHIYICDNNDSSNPLIYINNKVTVLPFHGIDFQKNGTDTTQCSIYNNVLSLIYDKYDYCGICDIDEFFHFKDCKNVSEFIQKHIIDEGCNCAELMWEVYDDNDLIYGPNKSVQETYTRVQSIMGFRWLKNQCSWAKPIFKLCPGISVWTHWPLHKSMTSIGGLITHRMPTELAICKHYRTKCLEEYMFHKFKNRNITCSSFTHGGNVLKSYFDFNIISLKKLLYAIKFSKELNYKLTEQDSFFMARELMKSNIVTYIIKMSLGEELVKKTLFVLSHQQVIPKLLILEDSKNTITVGEYAKSKNITIINEKELESCIETPYYRFTDNMNIEFSNTIMRDDYIDEVKNYFEKNWIKTKNIEID